MSANTKPLWVTITSITQKNIAETIGFFRRPYKESRDRTRLIVRLKPQLVQKLRIDRLMARHKIK